jgi:hypothetical protein
VGDINSKVYLAIAPLMSGYDGTGDVTLSFTLGTCRPHSFGATLAITDLARTRTENAACVPPGSVGLPLCSQWYWNAIGNDTQAHLARDNAAKTYGRRLIRWHTHTHTRT